MEPTQPDTSSKIPAYTFVVYILSLIGTLISIIYSQSCREVNCDLLPQLILIFVFIPLALISAITLITSFIRRKKNKLPISRFHRWTTLATILSPLWVPMVVYILLLTLYSGAFDFIEFKSGYTPSEQLRKLGL